jgi:hypothetical protein
MGLTARPAKAVSRRSLIAEALAPSQASPCGSLADTVALAQVFTRSLQLPPVSIAPRVRHNPSLVHLRRYTVLS